jgi:hypothetical protein
LEEKDRKKDIDDHVEEASVIEKLVLWSKCLHTVYWRSWQRNCRALKDSFKSWSKQHQTCRAELVSHAMMTEEADGIVGTARRASFG